eukprot:6306471-Prymnesium_polylepis.1
MTFVRHASSQLSLRPAPKLRLSHSRPPHARYPNASVHPTPPIPDDRNISHPARSNVAAQAWPYDPHIPLHCNSSTILRCSYPSPPPSTLTPTLTRHHPLINLHPCTGASDTSRARGPWSANL